MFVACWSSVVPAYLLPDSPIGSNAGRFFYVFGAPLLRRRRVAQAVTAASCRCWPWPPSSPFSWRFPVWMLARAQSFTATRAAFFAPALAYAGRVYDPDYRFHVVTPQMHWESYYFPAAGFPITRGWFRQADALHNDELYAKLISPAAYVAVAPAHGGALCLPPARAAGVHLEARGRHPDQAPAFTAVYRSTLWTVYRLRLAVAAGRAAERRRQAEVLTLDHTRCVSR